MINTKSTAEIDTASNDVDIRTTIKKDDWGDWVVRLFVDGKHQPAADYFAADKEDATETAASIVLERKVKWPCPKLWAEKYEAEKEVEA